MRHQLRNVVRNVGHIHRDVLRELELVCELFQDGLLHHQLLAEQAAHRQPRPGALCVARLERALYNLFDELIREGQRTLSALHVLLDARFQLIHVARTQELLRQTNRTLLELLLRELWRPHRFGRLGRGGSACSASSNRSHRHPRRTPALRPQPHPPALRTQAHVASLCARVFRHPTRPLRRPSLLCARAGRCVARPGWRRHRPASGGHVPHVAHPLPDRLVVPVGWSPPSTAAACTHVLCHLLHRFALLVDRLLVNLCDGLRLHRCGGERALELPVVLTQRHNVLQHEAVPCIEALRCLLQVHHAREVCVDMLACPLVVDVLADREQQLAEALDLLLVGAVLLRAEQLDQALVHDLFSEHLLFVELADETDVAECTLLGHCLLDVRLLLL
mmetsp:Transcript_24564/g.62188  ORF Transcript_24564/g.62188 Transcript_24564/m.62188 type:complete len:391 (-) Transcript_24564:1615-2787(-)